MLGKNTKRGNKLKNHLIKKVFAIRISLIALLTTTLIYGSCNQNQGHNSRNDWDKNNIRKINSDDTDYKIAIKIAQENIDIFDSVFRTVDTNLRFLIKKKFSDGEIIGHMWVIVDSFSKGKYYGILDNIPNCLGNIHYQGNVEIERIEIEDWMIYEGNTLLIGNFISNELHDE